MKLCEIWEIYEVDGGNMGCHQGTLAFYETEEECDEWMPKLKASPFVEKKKRHALKVHTPQGDGYYLLAQPDVLTLKTFSVFLGTAMEHQLPGRLSFLNDLVQVIEATYGEAFYAPRKWPTPDTFDKPQVAFAIVDQGLKTSKCFVLYYPDKVVSGALVELGMAISLGLPVLVYTEELENITYFLREGAPNVEVTLDQNDIWPWIIKQLGTPK